jgi:hypothetical protein
VTGLCHDSPQISLAELAPPPPPPPPLSTHMYQSEQTLLPHAMSMLQLPSSAGGSGGGAFTFQSAGIGPPPVPVVPMSSLHSLGVHADAVARLFDLQRYFHQVLTRLLPACCFLFI